MTRVATQIVQGPASDVELEPAASGARSRSVVALSRGLAILDAFSLGQRELGVNEIARLLGLHKSTVSRLCATLEQSGYLTRNGTTEKYRLGARVQQLTGASTVELRAAARDVLQQLVETSGETVTMVVRDGLDVVTIEVLEGPRMVRMQARVGARTQIHASAGAKAILASLASEDLDKIIDAWPLSRLTANTLTTKAALVEHLELTSQRGYSVDHEELEIGLRCVGAPVRDHTGEVVAAIAVSAPRHRLTEEGVEVLGRQVHDAAEAISSRLGAPARPVADAGLAPARATRPSRTTR